MSVRWHSGDNTLGERGIKTRVLSFAKTYMTSLSMGQGERWRNEETIWRASLWAELSGVFEELSQLAVV
jgi:hypothetical protein